jgi:NDP-sugar pyrophosphorylase family protein
MENKHSKTAFILAAGFGSRLKPFTDTLPKALVPYKGKPMIENVISKLARFGYDRILINTHHFYEKMNEYFTNRPGNENIILIHEEKILGTGGALKNAGKFIDNSAPLLIYNTDVDCDLNLNELEEFFIKTNASAVLCVQDRKTSRYLLCDKNNLIIGRTESDKPVIFAKHLNSYDFKRAFCGIHIINPDIICDFPQINEAYDIIPQYMKLISENKLIISFDISNYKWKDLGIPQNL